MGPRYASQPFAPHTCTCHGMYQGLPWNLTGTRRVKMKGKKKEERGREVRTVSEEARVGGGEEKMEEERRKAKYSQHILTPS